MFSLFIYEKSFTPRSRSLRPIDCSGLYKIAHSAARRIVAGRGAAVRMAMSKSRRGGSRGAGWGSANRSGPHSEIFCYGPWDSGRRGEFFYAKDEFRALRGGFSGLMSSYRLMSALPPKADK